MKNLAELRPLPEELRDNWGRAYQHWFVNPPSPTYLSDFERLQRAAGITDRLIVSVIERGLALRKPHVIAWAKTVLEGLVPYGVTTPEEWVEFEKEREKSKEAQRTGGSATNPKSFESSIPQQSSPDLYAEIEHLRSGGKS